LQTIEFILSENSIKVLDSQQLTEKHKLLVSVDIGDLSYEKAQEYLSAVTEAFKSVVDPASVLVYPDSIDVTLIEQ